MDLHVSSLLRLSTDGDKSRSLELRVMAQGYEIPNNEFKDTDTS